MIIVSPTDRWLKRALENRSASMSVSSPYVGPYLRDTVGRLDAKINVTLLTPTLLMDFASQASDLNAVQALADRSAGILSLSSLHAKVYVIDNQRALITSANEGISRIPVAPFTMNEVVAACAPFVAEQFPENRHVREKLRQQMQRLRDLGLVLFLGNGRYDRLASPD